MSDNGWKRVLIRDLLIFKVKLILDGLKDIGLIQVAIVAAVLDLIFAKGAPRYFYRVLRMSERFDLWLNVYGASVSAETSGDGLFGGSTAGSDTLLGKLEAMARGADYDSPDRRRARAEAPHRPRPHAA